MWDNDVSQVNIGGQQIPAAHVRVAPDASAFFPSAV
jgi:hypothetical protein